MKTTIKICAAILICIVPRINSFSQNINWASLNKDDRHLLNINAGLEHGLVFGIEYGIQFRVIVPVVVNVEYSFPSGINLIDDFKSKIGAKVRLIRIDNFQFSADIHGVYRRYANSLVRMQNFGSDFSGTAGYYRNHWFLAAEAGFDKAIVTHFKHSELYKEVFPEVQNGWYEPSTGGNFYYGLQAGISLGQHDLYIKAGKILTQDYKTPPTMPYIAEVGYNFRIR